MNSTNMQSSTLITFMETKNTAKVFDTPEHSMNWPADWLAGLTLILTCEPKIHLATIRLSCEHNRPD